MAARAPDQIAMGTLLIITRDTMSQGSTNDGRPADDSGFTALTYLRSCWLYAVRGMHLHMCTCTYTSCVCEDDVTAEGSCYYGFVFAVLWATWLRGFLYCNFTFSCRIIKLHSWVWLVYFHLCILPLPPMLTGVLCWLWECWVDFWTRYSMYQGGVYDFTLSSSSL